MEIKVLKSDIESSYQSSSTNSLAMAIKRILNAELVTVDIYREEDDLSCEVNVNGNIFFTDKKTAEIINDENYSGKKPKTEYQCILSSFK